jgi:hypothetical protein
MEMMRVVGIIAIIGAVIALAAAATRRDQYRTRIFIKRGVRAVIEECSEETRSAYVAAGWRELPTGGIQ